MKKWVCQNNSTHVFDSPTNDGLCPVCPNHEGILIEMETGPTRDPAKSMGKKAKANDSENVFADKVPKKSPDKKPIIPVIRRFETSKNRVKNEEHFSLSWDVENADKIELYKNNLLITLAQDQRSIDLRDYFDSNKTLSSYILVAYNDNKEVKSDPVIVSLFEPGKESIKPVIDRFYTNKNNVKSEESFTLSWDVKNADKVELYKDEVQVLLSANQRSIDLRDYYHDDKKRSSYVLIAYNDGAEIKSEPIMITLSDTSKLVEKPVIKQFYTSKTKVKNGEQFTLSWEIENADKVELYRNNVLIILNAGAKTTELNEVFESGNTEYSYLLVAFNGDIQTKSEVIIIGIAESKRIAERAVINKFYADKTKVKNGGRITLSWDVENAETVELYKNGILIKLNAGQKAINLNEAFNGGKNESNYVLIACKNSIETKSSPITISLDKSLKKFPVLVVVLASLIVIFAVYKFVASKSKVNFFVSIKTMHEGSDLEIGTENLRDTNNLHVLFNDVEGQKNSFTDALLLVKVPQLNISSARDSVEVSVRRGEKQLYHTRLAYISTPLPIHPIPTPVQPGYGNRRPLRIIYRGTAVTHDLIFNNHGVWGQSTAASAGHVAMLSWQGSSTLKAGAAGIGFLQMEDGSSYTVIYAHPTSPAEQSAVPDTVTGFFSFPGSSGKVFTSKIGLFMGNTNAKVTFEIWASNDQGKFVLIRQYPKVYDDKVVQISLQFPPTSSTSFKMELRITGSGSSIASAAWIGPKVIVDQLKISDRPLRRTNY